MLIENEIFKMASIRQVFDIKTMDGFTGRQALCVCVSNVHSSFSALIFTFDVCVCTLGAFVLFVLC